MSELLNADAACRPPGRPRLIPEAARRQHIVDAASSAFSRKGYWATTMDEVSREAGMSKKTVYQLFSSKADIFDVMLRTFTEPFSTPFETAGRTQRKVLTDGLVRMAKAALEDKQLEIVRVLIAEAGRSGDVADAIERQSFCQGDWALKDWLATQTMLGSQPVDDPERMASTLFWAVIGDFQIKMLVRICPRPSDTEITEHVERVVGFFYAPTAG